MAIKVKQEVFDYLMAITVDRQQKLIHKLLLCLESFGKRGIMVSKEDRQEIDKLFNECKEVVKTVTQVREIEPETQTAN